MSSRGAWLNKAEEMKLGILVNTDRHLDAVTGLAGAALAKGHEVIIFTMDEGTRLFKDPAYTALCSLQGVTMSFCDLSTKTLGIDKGALPDEIVCGSQYDNASMVHDADKVIVL
jgi:predicted peroxiredoxin